MKAISFLFLFFSFSIIGWGQTVLNPGDLVILGIDANLGGNPDEISFACFKDITTGTEIQITDQGYERCYPGLWGSGEGGAKMTRTGGTITAGTVITFRTSQSYAPYIHFTCPDSLWSIANLGSGAPANSFNMNTGGDQVYFAQGGTWTSDTLCSNHYPGAGRMLFAFSTSGGWVSIGNSTQKSGLYPDMSCFNMAPTVASDFVKYTGPMTIATQKDWVTRIGTVSNWSRFTSSALYLSGSPQLCSTVLPIIPGTDADWASPAPMCQSASPVNLNTLISGLGTTGGTWSGTGVTGSTFNPAGLSGTYNITYTNDCPCCISQTHTVTVNALTPTASSNSAICTGSTLNLTAGGGINYVWSGPNSFSNSNQNPSITNATTAAGGLYTVTVSDNNGCSSTAQTTVTVNASPVATASSNSAVCAGATLNLTAGGGVNYIWSGPDSFSNSNQNPSIVNAALAAGGLYTVTVTDNNGCSATAQTTVTVNANPIATASADSSLCAGATLNLISGGGTNYSWSGPNSFSSSTQDTSITNVTTAAGGLYTVTVADNNGCSATAYVNVTVNSLPVAYAGSDTAVCSGRSVNLFASGGTIYAWSPATGLSNASVQNPVATPSSTTIYTVTVTNSNSCSATDNVTITVHPLPVANAGNDQSICHGDTAMLSATGGNIYVWSNGNTAATISVFPAITSIYTVTATDANSCSASDNITVDVKATPVANAGIDQAICLGASATLSATGGGSYLWNTGDTLAIESYSPAITTTYIVTVSFTDGCSSTDEVTITVNPDPVVTVSSDPAGLAYVGQPITFTATVTPPDNNVTYNFYVNNILVQSGSGNVYQTNTLTNNQLVSVTISENGCSNSASVVGYEIKQIPNAFIPDGDNLINKRFVPGLKLTIINRWGQKLYEGTDGWDGKYNGNLVSPGTYYYIITIDDLQSGTTELKGSVTIVQKSN